MMEEDQEQGFPCKFCNKSFINGKCLGGHMRGHLALIAAQKAQQHDNGRKKVTEQSDADEEEQEEQEEEEVNKNSSIGSEDGYGLRENPKKSWRASGSNPNVNNVCKECNKGFQSMRALSGHMRCHSMKGKEESICKTCGRGFDSIRALFGHMRSHSKRSAETQIKSGYEPPFAIPKKRSRTKYQVTSNLNASSSSAVTSDANEVEEAAMCLMMLSRGVSNDCQILEAQSSSMIWDSNNDEQTDEAVDDKLDCGVSGLNNVLMVKNSSDIYILDSGSAVDDENKAEFGVCVEDSLSCDKLKNPTQNAEFASEIGSGQSDLGLMNLDLGENPSEIWDNSKNRGKNICFQENIGMSENSVNEMKNKEYECSICFKVFTSGQALGGHKRAHYTGAIDLSRAKDQAMLINQELPESSVHNNMFDLNVPLTLEDGAAIDHVGFKTWWIGGNHEYKQLVIFN